MARINIIRIAWPISLVFLPTMLCGIWKALFTPYPVSSSWFNPIDIWGRVLGITEQYFAFVPERGYLLVSGLLISLGIWFWKPNWLIGLLLPIFFVLLSPAILTLGITSILRY